jgi:hypothetical protein
MFTGLVTGVTPVHPPGYPPCLQPSPNSPAFGCPSLQHSITPLRVPFPLSVFSVASCKKSVLLFKSAVAPQIANQKCRPPSFPRLLMLKNSATLNTQLSTTQPLHLGTGLSRVCSRVYQAENPMFMGLVTGVTGKTPPGYPHAA